MRVEANGLEIEYEIDPDEGGEPLLLVNGFSVQLVRWPEGFLDTLRAAGFRVIRFDNRDVGLSSKLDHLGTPPMAAVLSGESPAPYSMADMAADAAGLVHALGVGPVHVVGMSMGGMIAQQIAIDHPDLVRTMTSVMSTTGSPDLPLPEAAAIEVLSAAPASTPEARIEQSVEAGRVLWGDSPFPFEEEEVRTEAAISEERCFHPDGVARQFLAILASADRSAALGSLRMPCLVMHGSVDPVFPVAHGEATASAIPDAKLEVYSGMGHGLPSPLWERQAADLAALGALA